MNKSTIHVELESMNQNRIEGDVLTYDLT